MILRRLEFKAFGPFTDRSLLFDTRSPGLHIVFGPNEAGKSSSLRGLKALLYGFPERTADNFLHSNDRLLVGGLLEHSDGRRLFFLRRKKRKADIVGEDGAPIDPALLAPFLHGAEAPLFESLYGLSHETLVQGGEEILALKGEIGQALFAAGAGISSLRAVIEGLDREAESLFKPAGQVPLLNTAIRRFKEAQKEARAAALSARDWQELRKSLERAGSERAGLKKELDETSRECRRLERLQQTIPELAALRAREEELRSLGEAVLLPADFNEHYQRVAQEHREARLQLERDRTRLAGLDQKAAAITLPAALLAEAARIDTLHQKLGAYLEAQKDRPERNGMRISLREEAAALLGLVRPDLPLAEAESLRPVLARRRSIQELSSRFEKLGQQLSTARSESRDAQRDLQAAERRLAALPPEADSGPLLGVVKAARRAGDLDALISRETAELQQERSESETAFLRLGLWSGSLEALPALHLPLAETVQRFTDKFATIEDRRRVLETEAKETEGEREEVGAELRRLEYDGAPPSESDLAEAREKRDEAWRLLRQRLEGGRADAEAAAPLAESANAYEGRVAETDHLADRLRREAERVATAAALRARHEKLERTRSLLESRSTLLAEDERTLRADWLAAWQPAGITPLSPKEMSAWLGQVEGVRYRLTELFRKQRLLEEKERERRHLRTDLVRELETFGETSLPAGNELGPVLHRAEAVLEAHAERARQRALLRESRQQAEKKVERYREELTSASEALSAWQADWRRVLAGLGLAEEIAPPEAMDLLEALQGCFEKLDKAEALHKRIRGIDRDAALFEAEVAELVAAVTPWHAEVPAPEAIPRLRAMLGQAQNDATLAQRLESEREALGREVAAAEKSLKIADSMMKELLELAGCRQPDELREAIVRSDAKRALLEKISAGRENLARIGAGLPVEELARQAEAAPADELPGRLELLRREIEERIQPRIMRVSEEIGELEGKRAAMDGSDRAATAAGHMEQELATIRRHAESFLRLKLASNILRNQIEHYREEHQDPILKRAGDFFSSLTLGSFTGIRPDIDDRGTPVLVGLRPDGGSAPVEGMSSGSRDQLYLALRLATLEWRLRSHEPMPLIVDDILINFDDARSRATLRVLADLAERNQVILFTHHRRIAEEARELENGEVLVHEL